ncbi:MAG: hypothetical protein ACRCX2_30625 [Paraclostridium sp.]
MGKIKESFHQGLGKMSLHDLMALHKKVGFQRKNTEALAKKLKEVQSKVKEKE